MSLLSLIGMGTAYANTSSAAHPSAGGSLFSALPMLIIFVLVFYFLLIRPQQKRAKEQRTMMDNLTVGDEVVTAGGIIGRITKLRDRYLSISIAHNIEIMVQRSSVASVLPKGTMDNSQE